jgi:hypothetical protein
MRGNRVLAGALLWLVAVATVAGLAWLAIDSAGKSVTALPVSQAGSGPAQGDQQSEPTSAPTDQATTPAAEPTGSPSSRNTSLTGLSSGVSTSASASALTSRSPDQPSSSSRPASSSASGSPPPHSPPPPRSVGKTVNGYWGSVRITCAGDRVTLQLATPANDWAVKKPIEKGPVQVEVEFSGERGASAHVQGECVGGQPVLTVEASGE